MRFNRPLVIMTSRERNVAIGAALALASVLSIGVTPVLAVHLCLTPHCSVTTTTPCAVDADCPVSERCLGDKGALEIDDPSGNVTLEDATTPCEDWQTLF